MSRPERRFEGLDLPALPRGVGVLGHAPRPLGRVGRRHRFETTAERVPQPRQRLTAAPVQLDADHLHPLARGRPGQIGDRQGFHRLWILLGDRVVDCPRPLHDDRGGVTEPERRKRVTAWFPAERWRWMRAPMAPGARLFPAPLRSEASAVRSRRACEPACVTLATSSTSSRARCQSGWWHADRSSPSAMQSTSGWREWPPRPSALQPQAPHHDDPD
jgi:hypothetical protein